MIEYPVYELTTDQETAADSFVDQGRGSYADWRQAEGIKPVGRERTPTAVARISLQAEMTAEGGRDYGNLVEQIGLPVPIIDGNENTR